MHAYIHTYIHICIHTYINCFDNVHIIYILHHHTIDSLLGIEMLISLRVFFRVALELIKGIILRDKYILTSIKYTTYKINTDVIPNIAT